MTIVDTWQLLAGVVVNRPGTLQSPRMARVTSTERSVRAREMTRTLETCLRCGDEQKGTKNVTCAGCARLGQLRAVCRNPTAHEVSHEPAPEAVVAEVWCMYTDTTPTHSFSPFQLSDTSWRTTHTPSALLWFKFGMSESYHQDILAELLYLSASETTSTT